MARLYCGNGCKPNIGSASHPKAKAQLREVHREVVDVFVSKLERIREIERKREEAEENEKQKRNTELENWSMQ